MVRFTPWGGLMIAVMFIHEAFARDIMESMNFSVDPDTSDTREKKEATHRYVNNRYLYTDYEKLKENGARLRNDHQTLNSTFATLKEYLEIVRNTRKGISVNGTDHSDLRKLSELMSEANLHLFGKNWAKEQDIGGRTLDQCGGSSALGIFNFLTFIVYAFSLLASLVAVATGNMANTLSGTFLSGLFDLLGNRAEGRSTRSVWRDGESREPYMKELHRALEHDLGSGLVAALLQLSGGREGAGPCLPPIANLASVSTREALARISGVQ
ncbi:uncharacterized protein LOC125045974 [Penaeus chinensis]|uniref:uncharacterized protein LOC125045974 n=1 Tax=Penaeus chinensis TaxID=139456 RepID=UPI001FB7E693|nr:uncharacterized protein LOC125045974 [Penaeus chinensis]